QPPVIPKCKVFWGYLALSLHLFLIYMSILYFFVVYYSIPFAFFQRPYISQSNKALAQEKFEAASKLDAETEHFDISEDLNKLKEKIAKLQ
ncbi:MAG: hypothetical protein ABIH89_00915, partial [Elusimicrobiota bacterium]